MYVNAKMIPVGTIPEMERCGIKEGKREGEFKYDTYCKNFCKYYNMPPPITTIKKYIKGHMKTYGHHSEFDIGKESAHIRIFSSFQLISFNLFAK
jgi:hypothetical protein